MSARRSSINTLDAGDAPVTSRPARPAGKADCARCDAVCCRLTVVLQREDRIPAHLTTVDERGVEQMARGEDGWCVALDAARMCCSIYNERPSVCRRFVMNGPYCRETRRMYYSPDDCNIPLRVE